MNTQELTALLDRLRAEPHESEWLEFKANRFEAQTLGEYLSALANSACLLGKAACLSGFRHRGTAAMPWWARPLTRRPRRHR